MGIAYEHMASPTKLYEIVLNGWRKVSTSYFDGRESSHDVNGQKVSSDGKMKRRKTMNMEDEASSSSWTCFTSPHLSTTSSTKSSPQPGMKRGSLWSKRNIISSRRHKITIILPEEPKKDENDEKNKDCDLMKGDGTKLLFLLLQNFPDCPLVSKLDQISRRE